MPDPITNSTIGSAAQPAISAIFIKVLIYVVGPVAASIVVMSMAQPKSAREWFAAIISTVMCSLGLGSYVISHYFGLHPVADELASMQAGAIYFLCGLPGWTAVRAIFYTLERYQNADILAILVIGLLIPHTSEELLGADIGAGAENIVKSPFTLVFERAGFAFAAAVMNAVILSSVLSAGNSGMYASVRMLYAMGKDGLAWPAFARTRL